MIGRPKWWASHSFQTAEPYSFIDPWVSGRFHIPVRLPVPTQRRT